MPYCPSCGASVKAMQRQCDQCGRFLKSKTAPAQRTSPDDPGGIGWGLLGFILPLVGLILFLVWNDTKPRTAKAAGLGALIAVITVFVLYIIVWIIIFAAFGAL